ncbi:MAG: HAD family hydrolase [bacterium]|nr:MAG: HAD family hydrolase [bacterium]
MLKGIQALLLDLDGTLIDIEVSFFLDTMIKSMQDHFRPHLDPAVFSDGLYGAIDAILSAPRRDGETNREAFYSAFERMTGLDASLAEKVFRAYYLEVFPGHSDQGSAAPSAEPFVRAAREKGLRLALATNPIFPAESVVERLRWGGLAPGLFDVISVLDHMRSCKPQREYFIEMSDALGVDPERCLMVGNDVEQDLPAAEVGMKTFLVERNVIHRGTGRVDPDMRGDLEELGRILGLW